MTNEEINICKGPAIRLGKSLIQEIEEKNNKDDVDILMSEIFSILVERLQKYKGE